LRERKELEKKAARLVITENEIEKKRKNELDGIEKKRAA
jgi:hypothetical protein